MVRGIRASALSTRARGVEYQPALDGVRAVAVAMVLVFHQGWLGGGYVGVSVFFTLSGYLITSLAVVEHDRTGRLDVGAFYVRRLRRLLPASLACLTGIVVLARSTFDDVGSLRRDVLGALAQVYNWVALSSGQAYADLVAGGDGTLSPVEHYWSLAIEEQFYWVWPLVMVAVLRRGRRRRVAIIAALTIVAALAAPAIAAAWGPDAAYWATPARLGEILVGALLAVVLHARRRAVPLPAATAWLGIAGLVVVVWAAVTWPSGSGPAYRGWLPVFALASAALILGLQVPSPLRRALAVRPLVALGVISYGVYLYHWPVYVVLDADRTGLAPVPLFGVRIAVTMTLAAVSFRVLEQPIRRGRPRRLRGPLAAAVACSSMALVVVVVPVGSAPYWMVGASDASTATLAPVDSVVELQAIAPATRVASAPTTTPPPTTVALRRVASTTAAPRRVASTTAAPLRVPTATVAPTTVAPTTVAPITVPATTTVTTAVSPVPTVPLVPPLPSELSRPVRILVVGDSTAVATGEGMVAWGAEHPETANVAVVAAPGCGFIRYGLIPTDRDDSFRVACAKLRDARIPAALGALQPDVVVGMVTMRDIEDRVWDDSEGPIGPFDDRFIARLVADYDLATQQFLSGGARTVLWVLAPIPAVPFQGEAAKVLDPGRYQRYAAGLAEVVARHAGSAAVVDLAGWLAVQPAVPDRPDGLHWSLDASAALAADFLGPVVVAATLA